MFFVFLLRRISSWGSSGRFWVLFGVEFGGGELRGVENLFWESFLVGFLFYFYILVK